MFALDTVAGAEATEVVTLHDTGEALALALAGHVHLDAGLEGRGGDLLAEGVLAGTSGTDLDEVTTGVTSALAK